MQMYQISLNTGQKKAMARMRKVDEVKLSLVKTFVGTPTYMMPVRLCGLNLKVQILQANYQFHTSLFVIFIYAKDLIKSLVN